MAFINLQKPENLTDLISALFTKRNANWDSIQANMGKVDTAGTKVILGHSALGAEAAAVAAGYLASAAGNSAIALGREASAAGLQSLAVGYLASAAGINSVCIGRGTANGENSVRVGYLGEATQDHSIAVGWIAAVTAPGGTETNGGQIGRGTHGTTKRIQLGHGSYANSVHIPGTLSKGAGTFEISHPHPAKKDTHDLRHFFVETNNYGGLIYNFRDVEVAGGTGQLTMPEYFGWLANPATIDIFCQPQKHFGRAYAEIETDQEHDDKPATLTITADTDGKYAIMVVAERNDPMISEMKARQTHLAEGGMVKDKGKTWDGEVTAIVDDEIQEDGDTMITKIYYSKEAGVATQKQEAQLHECRVSTSDRSVKLTPAEVSKKTSKQIVDLAEVKRTELQEEEATGEEEDTQTKEG